MLKISSLVVLLTTPPHSPLPNCGGVVLAEGVTINCCSLSNGQQCCSGTLDDRGKPSGCGC